MTPFQDLEGEHKQTPIRPQVGEGSGVLALAGRETSVRLSSPRVVRDHHGENGWLDVRVTTPDGVSVLLHNAIELSLRMPNNRQEDYESTLFPNAVVFGADRLTQSGKVNAISFTAKRLGAFFHYPVVEWQSLYRAPGTVRRSLREARKIERAYPRDYPFFAPRELFIVHRLPEVLRFRIEDRRYSVFMSQTERHGGQSLQIETWPLATIRFDKPVSIDTAIDHAWDWRRFFSQAAMERLLFRSMALHGHLRNVPPADLYLPNLEETEAPDHGPFAIHAGHAPLNFWSQRRQSSALMQTWLGKQPERRMLRARLDRVLADIHTRSDLDHVLALAGGLESLDDFKGASAMSKADIKVLVDGALTAAKAADIAISLERLNGLMGQLANQSLSGRLKRLSDAVAPLMPGHRPEIVGGAVNALRNAAAHGHDGLDASLPQLSPATYALAGMCALWDLSTCGLAGDELQRTNAFRMAAEGLGELQRLKAPPPNPTGIRGLRDKRGQRNRR